MRDTISASTIKAYSADSIGELLKRLSARFRGGFLVLINGRRLASIDAINALPPEALQRIELLNPSAGGQYGVGSGSAVINLALRPRFQSTSLEADGTNTTEGKGDVENGAVRYSRIRKNKRLNVAFAYNRQSGLLKSDREALAVADPSAAYYSLVPRQTLATLTSGYAAPIGAFDLDSSMEIGTVRSDTLTGPIAVEAGTFELSRQQSDTRYIRSGATLSGNSAPFFWSLLMNGEVSRTTITNARGGDTTIPIADFRQSVLLATLPMGTQALNRSIGITATISGPLFTLPAGTVTLDGSSSARASSLTSTLEDAAHTRITNLYNTFSTHAGLTVPIARRGVGLLGRLGDLSLREGIDYLSVSELGGAVGTSSALEWAPTPGLFVSAIYDTVPTLPSVSQRFAPIALQPGMLIYDVVADRIVPVTVLTGGRNDIRTTQSSTSTILMSYQANTVLANVTGSITYSVSNVQNPLLSISTPSPLAQALLPGLFERDSDGTLVQFDARAFNGFDETTRQVSASLHLNGPGSKKLEPSGKGDTSLDSPPPRNALSWDLNLSYSYTLSHRLRLAMAGKLDLLTTPLSLAGPESARHRLGVQWNLSQPGYGLNGSFAWNSGARVRSIDSIDTGFIRYSSVTKINVEGFIELDHSAEEANPRRLRLKVSIDNLLNRRLRVTGYPGLDSRSQQLLIDPYGRTFRIGIRKLL